MGTVSCTPASGSLFPLGATPVTCTATDQAGNSAQTSFQVHIIDDTGPVITPTVTGTLGANGWYVSDVQIGWTVVDDNSAIGSSSGCETTTLAVDTDLSGVTYTCSATSAGGTTTQSVTVKRDATTPTITYTERTPPANANGWNNGPVTVTWTCSDGGSGIVAETVSQTLSSDGANQAVTGVCTDLAGNTVSDTQIGINIDQTAPTLATQADITAIATAPTGATVNYTPPTATDALSGMGTVSCTPASGSLFPLGATTVTCTATDQAGNSAQTHFQVLIIDDTAPVITPTVTGTLGANGWYVSDVQIGWTVVDDNSAIGSSSGCETTTLAVDTNLSGVTYTCSATSAGGTTTQSVTVKRDATTPTITYTERTPPANANGWNNSAVTVTWTCSDSGSGVVVGTVNQTLSSEGANQSATGVCADQAGNTSSNTQSGIGIDTTTPTLAAQADITAIATDPTGATVNYTPPTATDALSGMGTVSCTPASGSLFPLGATPVTCTATDQAGNSAQTSFQVHIIDDTPPVITPTVTGTLGANGWYVSDVQISWTVVDDNSAIGSSSGCETTTLAVDTDLSGVTYTCQRHQRRRHDDAKRHRQAQRHHPDHHLGEPYPTRQRQWLEQQSGHGHVDVQ